jgi:hypothetical protein
MFRLIPALLLLVVTVSAPLAQEDQGIDAPPEVRFDRSEVTIETARGASHRFTVEMATNPMQRARGLMFRESMPQTHGMLFVFDSPRRLSFWMRNTLIPLDMLFLDRDGRVINIARRTTPRSDRSYQSAGPALAVLEINGGLSGLLGIAPGDRVIHPRLGGR